MKKQGKDKHRYDYDEKEGGHNYKRLRTEHQRKANNALDKVLKQKNFDYRRYNEDDYEHL